LDPAHVAFAMRRLLLCSTRFAARQILPGRRAAGSAVSGRDALARTLPVRLPDWRKILSHLLPPRLTVIRLFRLLAVLLPLAAALPADAEVRIKDIADVEGV